MSEEIQEVEGKVVLVAAEGMDDWFAVERAEHDGRHWMEPVAGGAALRYSGRISDADVEGTGEDMLALAKAIRARGQHDERRCAVDAVGERVLFWSPRNSMMPASISREAAEDLATQIEARLGK